VSLYAIGDPHLSFGVPEKNMDRFGEVWHHHEEKLRANWLQKIREEDTVLLAGDLSWGRNLEECRPDFDFIRALPGRKILLRGNHDMFWDARHTERLNAYFQGAFFFLQDNYAVYQDYALAGTKGYCYENLDSFAHFRKLEQRESERLRKSLEAAQADGYRKFIVFLHYPPTSSLWPPVPELCRMLGLSAAEESRIRGQEQQILLLHGGQDTGGNPVFDINALPEPLRRQAAEITEVRHSPFTELAEEYGAEQVIYGHCHGAGRFHDSLRGEVNGILYRLVSGDCLNFDPQKILD